MLAKFVCHNLCCLISAMYELGINPVFWPEDDREAPMILPLRRPGQGHLVIRIGIARMTGIKA